MEDSAGHSEPVMPVIRPGELLVSRRQVLAFLGAAASAPVLDSWLPSRPASGASPGGGFLGSGPVTPLRLPHQLPAYGTGPSYLPSGPTTGTVGDHSAGLTSYTIYDDVVVAPEFERYVILRWGDRVFPGDDDYVGFNADYTAFLADDDDTGDGYLWVNHESVSFPFSLGAPETPKTLQAPDPKPAASFPLVIGDDIDGPGWSQRQRWGEYLYNIGGSVVRIRRGGDGRFAAVADDTNRRYHGLSGLRLNAGRPDTRLDGTPYSSIVDWGPLPHQQGDLGFLVGTGPAATDVFPLCTDGLGNQIIGTGFNCSGSRTPWGTILSAEENFHGFFAEDLFVGVTEAVGRDGRQTGYLVGDPATVADPATGQSYLHCTTGTYFGLVGEKYGWIVEVDPRDPSFRARKHTALGRFRHENVGLRAEKGKRVVAYMGDDRRGGHVWKFVSRGTIENRRSRANSRLFEDGVLYVARFEPDGTGRWIPLAPDTPVDPIPPSVLRSQEAAKSGTTSKYLKLRLPRRDGVAGQKEDGGAFDVTLDNEESALASYRTKDGAVAAATLADYYTTHGALLCDAFLAANLAGGTPAARPEDLEVSPLSGRDVFCAFTDGVPGPDGYPDSRIFTVGKYTAAIDTEQPSGGLYRITEDSDDGTGLGFRWERFRPAGEVGAGAGSGFANIDNLVFDGDVALWGTTDMATNAHNGFGLEYDKATLRPASTNIDHASTTDGAKLVGVFGCSWLFYVPLQGPEAGLLVPFAYGPPRCEMTGPTFVGDTLIISVQHPGEDSPINGDPNAGGPDASILNRGIEMLDISGGSRYTQSRTLPRGSNWPSNIPAADGGGDDPTGPPRPSVIGIRRKPTGRARSSTDRLDDVMLPLAGVSLLGAAIAWRRRRSRPAGEGQTSRS